MRIGKAITASVLAVSLVSSPALAGAEKLAISAAAAQDGEYDDGEGAGISGTVIAVLAAAAIAGGVAVAAGGSSDSPTSP